MRISDFVESGEVGCALLTDQQNLYTGISIDTSCSLGFCAEHAAIAEMLKHGESVIEKLVAIDEYGNVCPPCGRCRELISQLSWRNRHTKIMVDNDTVMSLASLTPYDWKLTRPKGGNNI